jgi:hypothetical protein
LNASAELTTPGDLGEDDEATYDDFVQLYPDGTINKALWSFASLRNSAEAKFVPVEAHWSIGKLERYYAPLRHAFEILHAELRGTTSTEATLQMAVKAVKDTVGPDGLVPTLLVLGMYPRITLDSPPSQATWQRADAIQKAMKALREIMAERQVREALGTRNGSSTAEILALPLQSEVRVWCEKDGWQVPYRVALLHGLDENNIPQGPPGESRQEISRNYPISLRQAPAVPARTRPSILRGK